MTAKTTVEITALDANGDPIGKGQVTVELKAGPQGGSVDGQIIAARSTVHLDASGSGTVDLYPNAAITPTGSFYALAVARTSIVRCIVVPSSGPVDWSDDAIQVVPAVPPIVVPPASAGVTGDALIVNAEGTGYELGQG